MNGKNAGSMCGRGRDVSDCAGGHGTGDIPPELRAVSVVRPLPNLDVRAKVMGIPHPFLGESVEACVVLRDGVEFDERRLRVAMRKRLSPHKIPSHIVAFQAFPLGSSGKVDVLRLKEMLKDRLRDLDA